MDYKGIFERAYRFMDVNLTEGNCGESCGYHCCRNIDESGKIFGLYFLPFEYELMQKGKGLIDESRTEVHTKIAYEMPKGVRKLYYGFCKDNKNCIRELRPIQCRTYPLVPHLESGVLSLVIEKNQEHQCPLIQKRELWNTEFEVGILNGWKELLQISQIKVMIEYESEERIKKENIQYL
ncbi:MAG: hypothetical protein JW702_05335 [Clostridiales bacterium]|nr:hypothetical protein [Clostridiales bacterium]